MFRDQRAETRREEDDRAPPPPPPPRRRLLMSDGAVAVGPLHPEEALMVTAGTARAWIRPHACFRAVFMHYVAVQQDFQQCGCASAHPPRHRNHQVKGQIGLKADRRVHTSRIKSSKDQCRFSLRGESKIQISKRLHRVRQASEAPEEASPPPPPLSHSATIIHLN